MIVLENRVFSTVVINVIREQKPAARNESTQISRFIAAVLTTGLWRASEAERV